MAENFIAWLTSTETQDVIAKYGVDKYGQALFYPSSTAWCAAHTSESPPGCSG
jgi:ABC-type tungstate transport system permease subunit